MTLSLFSGRLDTLESQVTQLFQELLLRVDIETLGNVQRVLRQTIDSAVGETNTQETRIDNLEGLYSNIAYTLNTHTAAFTGFTGSTTYTLTGHTGATTGDGVHGHS